MTHTQLKKFSYWFILAFLVAVLYLKIAAPLITILFASLVLRLLSFSERRWLALLLYLLVVAGIFYGFIFFVREAVSTLPRVAETSIPIVMKLATDNGIEMPFTDVDGLKALVVEAITDELQDVARFAGFATEEFLFLIVGLVVAAGLFFNGRLDLSQENASAAPNLYACACREISERFTCFYRSFTTVMGAQLIISTINTVFTAVFVLAVGLPYAKVAIAVTFLCGILPIVGNLISNTLIICIALSKVPTLAVYALAYLVILHKLEYFLNSKIIGGRIKNPMWLTLAALLVGERVAGIPGMILAPVILHYVKSECSTIPVGTPG